MGLDLYSLPLPDAESPHIALTHPTDYECLKIWELSSLAWRDALTLPLYLEESKFLTTVPLAKDGGMTIWILVDRTLPPNQRPILCACESFRKRAFLSTPEGNVTEHLIHGVASVFCDPKYRNRGYAARLMKELAKTLPSWQSEENTCIGSVLYSDIGRKYYADLGWHPFPNNSHIKFAPVTSSESSLITPLMHEDVAQLCQEDETMIRKSMTARASQPKLRMALVPDVDHILWHHSKEEFACEKLFGKVPQVKGAVAGRQGCRVWVIWTHRYYGSPHCSGSGNTLYILRLVLEGEAAVSSDSSEYLDLLNTERRGMQMENLRAIIRKAQAEAAEWQLSSVVMWDPTSLVEALIEKSGVPHRKVEREDESIASLLWFGDGSGKEDMIEWVVNEKFAWC